MKKGKKQKERRQKTANDCLLKRSNRTDEEQFRKLDREGWKAEKERSRLAKRTKDGTRESVKEITQSPEN